MCAYACSFFFLSLSPIVIAVTLGIQDKHDYDMDGPDQAL
jgi:hypothetical protein